MGCAGSKKDPSAVLVSQPITDDQPPLMRDACVKAGYLELQTRAVKGSILTSAVGERPQQTPTVTAFDKVGSTEQLIQVAQDVWSCPPRDAMITLFDASEQPAAVLTDLSYGSRQDARGAVLYARDAPDLSNGNDTFALITDMNGVVIFTVPASKTTADGVVMHAVCRVRRGRRLTFGEPEPTSPFGMFFLGADGTFNERADLYFDDGDVFCQCVKNNKGEVVAYRTVAAKEYYVAAGVDATHVIALTATQDLFKTRPTKAQAR